jgi:hypothetical protein
MPSNLHVPGLPAEIAMPDDLRSRVLADVEAATRSAPLDASPTRIGRDLEFDVVSDDGARQRYELVERGTRLRDPKTGRRWDFPAGRSLLAYALPQLLAADEEAADREDELEGGAGDA